MRVSVFSTGRVREKRGSRGARRYITDDWNADTLPVNVFLIEHPRGLCLVDTGQTARAAEPGYFPGWYPFFRLARFELGARDEAASQIAAAGFELRDVRWVVLTHLHTDHAGGVDAFAHAEIVVPREEWRRAQGVAGRLRGYLPQRWPNAIRPHVVDFDAQPVGPFPGAYDVASDGSLLLVPLPGHTAGHAGVLVRGSRTYLCAGDAAHRADEFPRAQPAIADWCAREHVTVLTAHDDLAANALAAGDSGAAAAGCAR